MRRTIPLRSRVVRPFPIRLLIFKMNLGRFPSNYRYHLIAACVLLLALAAIRLAMREAGMFSLGDHSPPEKATGPFRKSDRNVAPETSAARERVPAPAVANDENRRRDAFSSCINLLLERRPEELTSATDRAELLRLLARNPMDALAWVSSLNPDARQSGLLLALAMEWARLDGKAAWQWAKKHPEDGVAAAVLYSSVSGGGEIRAQAAEWFRTDRERAEMRQGALIGLISNNNQWKRALEIVELCEPDTHENYLRYSLSSAAVRDPKQALEIAGSLQDPAMKDALTKMIFTGWAPNHAGDLANHALALPAGEMREFAVTMAAVKLLQKDPAELDRWLELHPEHAALRDSEPVLFSRQVEGLEMNFMTAMKWADRIPDAERKFKAVEYIAIQLAEFSPAKASDYVKSTAGDDERLKSRLLSSLNENGP